MTQLNEFLEKLVGILKRKFERIDVRLTRLDERLRLLESRLTTLETKTSNVNVKEEILKELE